MVTDRKDFELLLDAIKKNPQDYSSYQLFFASLSSISDQNERSRWIESAIACAPRSEVVYLAFADVWARSGMGVMARDPEIPQLGIHFLKRALECAEPSVYHSRIHSNLSFLYNEIGQPAAAEAHGRLAAGYENAIYHLWLAEALFRQRKFSLDENCAINFSTLSIESLHKISEEINKSSNKNIFSATEKSTIILSVDSKYFCNFAIPQILNVYNLESKINFHYHILNLDDQARSVIQKVKELCPEMSITFSSEQWISRGSSVDKTYYACSRFLIASQFLLKMNTNVVICDADILFCQKPEDIISLSNGFDIAHADYIGEPMCSRYNASFFVANKGMKSYFILRMIEEFLKKNFERYYIWMIDQVALYCCIERAKEAISGGVSELIWPENVLPAHPTQEPSALLTGAASSKWKDSPYLRLKNDILIRHGLDLASFSFQEKA